MGPIIIMLIDMMTGVDLKSLIIHQEVNRV